MGIPDLTKFPKRMAEFDIPANAWAGTSVDCQARVASAEAAFANIGGKYHWLSCEPLIEPLEFKHLDRFDLIVIGGASQSSMTPKWIPPFSWIEDLHRQAEEAGCAVFMKSNLYRKKAQAGHNTNTSLLRLRFLTISSALPAKIRRQPDDSHPRPRPRPVPDRLRWATRRPCRCVRDA
jgi:protein gp37